MQQNIFTRFLSRQKAGLLQSGDRATSRIRDASSESLGRPSSKNYLEHLDALGEYKRVLTSGTAASELAEQGFRVSDDTRKRFAVVDMGAGVLMTLASDDFFGTARYHTMLEQLKQLHFSVTRQFVTTGELIADLHRSKGKKGDGAANTQALKHFRDYAEHGVRFNASDMHVEVRKHDGAWIFFRVNGVRRRWRSFDPSVIDKAFSSAYGDLSETHTNSDANFQKDDVRQTMVPIDLGDRKFNLRWISYPVWAGYDITCRFLPADDALTDMMTFEDMGYEPCQIEQLMLAAQRGSGLTAFSGITGSGKTTAERTLTYNIPGAKTKAKKGISVEVPMEYPRPWMSQLSVQQRVDDTPEKIERDLLARLRIAVRADPDYLCMTEIKDKQTAALLSEFTLSGHPTFTSLHGSSWIGALTRLVGQNLQVPREYLGDERYLNTLVHQHLLPLMCTECRIPAEDVLSPSMLDVLRGKFGLDTKGMYCENEAGCEHCRIDGLEGGGVTKATVVAELVTFNREMRALAMVGDWAGLRNAWLSTRVSTAFDHPYVTGKSMFEHAMLKVSRGEIDPRRVDSEIEAFDVFEPFVPQERYGLFHRNLQGRGI